MPRRLGAPGGAATPSDPRGYLAGFPRPRILDTPPISLNTATQVPLSPATNADHGAARSGGLWPDRVGHIPPGEVCTYRSYSREACRGPIRSAQVRFTLHDEAETRVGRRGGIGNPGTLAGRSSEVSLFLGVSGMEPGERQLWARFLPRTPVKFPTCKTTPLGPPGWNQPRRARRRPERATRLPRSPARPQVSGAGVTVP